MKIQSINVVFQSPSATPDSPARQQEESTEKLAAMQDQFRERIRLMLDRAVSRQIEEFEMAGLDNRYPDFPVIGAAKIAAQELMKVVKAGQYSFREILIYISDRRVLETYQSTFEGYVRHMENGLGQEPFPTVDVIIELEHGIILIERSNPPYGWALPGGFIDAGEPTQVAAIREAKEETNMDLADVRQFRVYDTPGRDPRFQTSSTVFIGRGIGQPQFGDDARGLKIIPYTELLNRSYAFDHKAIIRDYLTERQMS